MAKKNKRIEFNEEDRKYFIYENYYFRNFLKNQGKKYTKQERQKYNEKLHADKKRQEKKDQNKVVRFISLTNKYSYRSNRELKKDIKKCLVK
jgi:hypothetical protein